MERAQANIVAFEESLELAHKALKGSGQERRETEAMRAMIRGRDSLQVLNMALGEGGRRDERERGEGICNAGDACQQRDMPTRKGDRTATMMARGSEQEAT